MYRYPVTPKFNCTKNCLAQCEEFGKESDWMLKKLLQLSDQTVESPRSFQPYWESSLKLFDSLLIMCIFGWRKETKDTLWEPEFKNWSWLHSIVVNKTMWLKIVSPISYTPTELRCSALYSCLCEPCNNTLGTTWKMLILHQDLYLNVPHSQ